MLCVTPGPTSSGEGPTPTTTSNPRRPHFGLSFYDEDDAPVENVLTSATRPCQPRNPQPEQPSTPAPEAPPLPLSPVPTVGPAPSAPIAPPMSSHPSELKAALPADFSGKNDDATQWIKAMKAYFTLNSTLYSSNAAKIMTTLNKMSGGRGAPYAEIWYNKMVDTSITNSEKTFDKFTLDFESTFYPFNTQMTAYNKLLALRQTPFKEKNGNTNDRFQQYITDCQNLSMNSGMKEELSLISQFSLGLDQKITDMILSMSPIHSTVKGWIDQSKIFHTQKVCILTLQKG